VRISQSLSQPSASSRDEAAANVRNRMESALGIIQNVESLSNNPGIHEAIIRGVEGSIETAIHNNSAALYWMWRNGGEDENSGAALAREFRREMNELFETLRNEMRTMSLNFAALQGVDVRV
jgi:hypothetical protein